MLYKKRKGASADNYRPKTANPEKMIVNILRSDFNRNQVRVQYLKNLLAQVKKGGKESGDA